MTSKEQWKFHHMSYSWKKANPESHSCALCKNRPIDFCNVNDNIRENPEPAWAYLRGHTNQIILKKKLELL